MPDGRNTDTKRRIFEEAAKLFAERGYDDVSTRDIASSVGITEGGIYRHYISKAAIMEEIMRVFRQKLELYLSVFEKKQIETCIETETAQQVLERCVIYLSEEDMQFMARGFRITFREHLTAESCYESLMSQIHDRVAAGVKYVMDRLVEKGRIPAQDTTAFSLVWARTTLFTSLLWVSSPVYDDGKALAEETEKFTCIRDWLIHIALGE